jgi:uncharacterized SAM-binding protein YcdF (DUF218 family)
MVEKVQNLIRRIFKVAAFLSLLLLIGIGTYWIYLYQQIRSAAVHDEAHPADAIIVLGAAQYNGRPSPVLKARLDHALHLRNQGYAFAIITTGSYGSDPYYSEAQVSTNYLIENGVDADEIITEQGSLTSLDSTRAASEIMRSKNWKTALVVSDGFHLYRLKTMFADEGITAFTSPAPASPIEVASSHRFWYSLREVVLCSAYRLIDL